MIKPAADGSYNLEAVKSETEKAWKSTVVFSSGKTTDAGTLGLAPVGSIVGKVLATDQRVTDFQNTQVYIPGPSYVAVTGPDGAFVMKNVPVGAFGLHAFNQYLGDADSGPNVVTVASNKATTAPPLIMAVAWPELLSMTREGTDQVTDNGGVGAVLTLHGKNVGNSKGAPFSVLFNGLSAEAVTVKSDDLAIAKIPAILGSGEVYVRVGFHDSNHLKFRLIKSFGLFTGALLQLADNGCSYDFSQDVDASDGNRGFPKADIRNTPPVYKANIAWSTNSEVGSISPDGLFIAASAGVVDVRADAGSKLLALVKVTVKGPCEGKIPTPAPSSAPTPSPTPVPVKAQSVTISPQAPGPLFVPGVGPGMDLFLTSIQLSAAVQMRDGATVGNVVWSTSGQIVSVSPGGLVTAQAAGSATVLATSLDGEASASVVIPVYNGAGADTTEQ